MLTVGVDLAAESAGTAIATLEWGPDGVVVADLALGVGDAAIVEASRDAAVVGIDCPFGWPSEYVDFVTAHAQGVPVVRSSAGKDWRRRLAYRDTDRVIHRETGRWPLSVSTDRLGLTAMRCAELLDGFASAGELIDRSGGGRLVEVYPGAALRVWGIAVAGYKSSAAGLSEANQTLFASSPWLSASERDRQLMARSNDAYDAVIAALNARAHALGKTLSPSASEVQHAKSEGWIALPTGSIGELIGPERTSGV